MTIRDINLVPSDVLLRRYISRRIVFWASCLCILMSLIFSIHLYIIHVAFAQTKSAVNVTEIDAQIMIKNSEIKNCQQELKNLNSRFSDLKALSANYDCSWVLLALSKRINEHTWLTLLKITKDKQSSGQADMQLTGHADSNEALADFLNAISLEPMIQNVHLRYAREAESQRFRSGVEKTGGLVNFHIDCRVGPEEQ